MGLAVQDLFGNQLAYAGGVLESMSTGFISVFIGAYAFAYLKVGAEVSFVPQARYAYAVGLVLAIIAIVNFLRARRTDLAPVVQPS